MKNSFLQKYRLEFHIILNGLMLSFKFEIIIFRSNNARVATWLEVPDSRFLLEFVRPDFLMLRTLAKGLIMWDTIMPDFEWIQSHVPASMRSHCLGMI